MYIKSITKIFLSDNRNIINKITTYGRYKDYNITIDNFKFKDGITIGKRFIIVRNNEEIITNKLRNNKGFNIIG